MDPGKYYVTVHAKFYYWWEWKESPNSESFTVYIDDTDTGKKGDYAGSFGGRENVRTGWQTMNGGWYYLNNNGVKQTGWQAINGRWYYMNSDGVMQTGWQYINGRWYYMDQSGVMATGWRVINGTYYYLTSSGGIAYSEYYEGYWLNADGSWTYPYKATWYWDGYGWWYGDNSGWYARDQIAWIDGTPYRFDAYGYIY